MRRIHLLLLFLFIIIAYFALWFLTPVKEIAFLVVDKTVPMTDYREHRAIFWLAKHGRIAGGEDGSFLDAQIDYLGYHPETDRRDTLTADDLENIRLLYLADTYGIYDYEESLEVYEHKLPYEEQFITLQYGGFSVAETDVISGFAEREGTVMVGEHNIFGYPTYLEPEAAQRLQDIFGVKYDGWLLRYFDDLDEVAFWIKQLYMRLYGKEWDFEGRGIVVLREDVPKFNWREDLMVFEKDDLAEYWPGIFTEDHRLTAGTAPEVPYLYWMEIINPEPETEVLAYYEVPLKEDGIAALKRRGLEPHIPAMTLYEPLGGNMRIYFAGDFADQLPAIMPAWLTGSAGIQRFFTYLPGMTTEYRFYFRWYAPIFYNIFKEVSQFDERERK